ncbi:G-protein alpha subunit [Laetiporus sulphureus 93-53]|uniref:G-protein alpha subunit n=1 Tax=Laetiporus sulphureus 93-53 TaxID=1314785 RepID=A0A165GI58_9APHY|nr:G-protein alpha subunit [Laetiporus sulphureus 93-53]KZT10381.1 G-protein alpha subunit [Laetiporus sulphureus 93-53]
MRWTKFSSSGPVSPSIETWPPYPPLGETELERAVRLEEEREAKRISESIDHGLELEQQELRKRRNQTRVLLLGQSESGKSTVLKNFQLHFAPEAFRAETEAWRAVIHLNLVRSVNFIMDVLSGQEELRQLRMQLSPLRQVEMMLVKSMSASDPSHSASVVEEATPWFYGRASEVLVRGGSSWKALLRRRKDKQTRQTRSDDLEVARHILHACREDIASMWSNSIVQAALLEEGVSLQEQAGFFLDDAARVADLDYEPSLSDILRARLQTIGVEEHVMTAEKFGEASRQWVFYDVGGSRGQRASWVPFFEDVNAILFLCSMAAFNEVLLEDRSVNRLLDSFNLWRTICSSKLLKMTTFVLLLNKSDILKAKLETGISFVRYVKSYKDEPNDYEHVSEYLQRKFIAYHRHYSPNQRQLHVHVTCAIDIDTTATVITRIRDAIIVNNLISSDYL